MTLMCLRANSKEAPDPMEMYIQVVRAQAACYCALGLSSVLLASVSASTKSKLAHLATTTEGFPLISLESGSNKHLDWRRCHQPQTLSGAMKLQDIRGLGVPQ